VPPASALTVHDDSLQTAEDQPQTIDVVANDTTSDGARATVVSVSGAAHGTASLSGDGTITYTPDADFNGSDAVTYTASDSAGNTASASLLITVEPVNDSPVASEDFVVVPQGANEVTIRPLDNDMDVDGDPLSIDFVSDPEHGDLQVDTGGSALYVPDLGFTGTDTLDYVVTDLDGLTSEAVITVTVEGGPDPGSPAERLRRHQKPMTIQASDLQVLDGPFRSADVRTPFDDGKVPTLRAGDGVREVGLEDRLEFGRRGPHNWLRHVRIPSFLAGVFG
jgi:CshA-type fibril repeat protein